MFGFLYRAQTFASQETFWAAFGVLSVVMIGLAIVMVGLWGVTWYIGTKAGATMLGQTAPGWGCVAPTSPTTWVYCQSNFDIPTPMTNSAPRTSRSGSARSPSSSPAES